jgi:hypothetical protein
MENYIKKCRDRQSDGANQTSAAWAKYNVVQVYCGGGRCRLQTFLASGFLQSKRNQQYSPGI